MKEVEELMKEASQKNKVVMELDGVIKCTKGGYVAYRKDWLFEHLEMEFSHMSKTRELLARKNGEKFNKVVLTNKLRLIEDMNDIALQEAPVDQDDDKQKEIHDVVMACIEAVEGADEISFVEYKYDKKDVEEIVATAIRMYEKRCMLVAKNNLSPGILGDVEAVLEAVRRGVSYVDVVKERDNKTSAEADVQD